MLILVLNFNFSFQNFFRVSLSRPKSRPFVTQQGLLGLFIFSPTLMHVVQLAPLATQAPLAWPFPMHGMHPTSTFTFSLHVEPLTCPLACTFILHAMPHVSSIINPSSHLQCLCHLTWFPSTIICPCGITIIIIVLTRIIIIIESKKMRLLQRRIDKRSTRIMVLLPPKMDYSKKPS